MDHEKIEPAHILLIEDNEGDILLTLEAFEECKMKAKISVVKNGKEALDFLFVRGAFSDAKMPDLILLDINIPIFNGHEVLRQIKTDLNLKKIPVIMLTTSSSQRDLDKAYENHCNSYIKKPLNIDDFLSTVLKIEEFWFKLTTLPD
jgi:CheY-like chemotaxis protein